jgi:hypothetical protein
MKKIIILLFLIITLSGCTIDYSVEFNSNGYVYDKMYVVEKYTNFPEYEPEEWNEIKNSKVSVIKILNETDEELAWYNISLKDTYHTFDEYFNNEYFTKYVGNYEYEDGDICSMNIIFNDVFKFYAYGEDEYNVPIKDFTISVSFPYDVVDSNATSEENGVYTWKLSRDNQLDRIYIKYNNPKTSFNTNSFVFKTIVIIIFVFLALFVYIIFSKKKKSDAI